MNKRLITYCNQNISWIFILAKRVVLAIFLLNAVPVIDLIQLMSSYDNNVEINTEYTFLEKKDIEEEDIVLNKSDFTKPTLIYLAYKITTLKPVLFVQGIVIPPPEFV